ncbi:DUF4157 domain-containing protein [Kineosporia sp. J2-2]|uniref:DUF4157 domain-containing protein n=1 Tax=Kineosporia corallincola TaxID=2835133 RepID=A0ABS5TGP8_9ACTN|nr:DUF4157 domain-containing protein [Kineosporia corallincola]MBT0770237.1 DUF4157 domain-containing protein [Kineosporia corallincola]
MTAYELARPAPDSRPPARRPSSPSEPGARNPVLAATALAVPPEPARLRRSRDPLGGHAVPPALRSVLRARASTGHALPPQVARDLGGRFGQDFTDVSIHHDAEASDISRALQARAFTVGRDIYFRAGAYAPHSIQGRELLAHELAHAVTAGPPAGVPIVQPAQAPGEEQADDLAHAALTGRPIHSHHTIAGSRPSGDIFRAVDKDCLNVVGEDHQVSGANRIPEWAFLLFKYGFIDTQIHDELGFTLPHAGIKLPGDDFRARAAASVARAATAAEHLLNSAQGFHDAQTSSTLTVFRDTTDNYVKNLGDIVLSWLKMLKEQVQQAQFELQVFQPVQARMNELTDAGQLTPEDSTIMDPSRDTYPDTVQLVTLATEFATQLASDHADLEQMIGEHSTAIRASITEKSATCTDAMFTVPVPAPAFEPALQAVRRFADDAKTLRLPLVPDTVQARSETMLDRVLLARKNEPGRTGVWKVGEEHLPQMAAEVTRRNLTQHLADQKITLTSQSAFEDDMRLWPGLDPEGAARAATAVAAVLNPGTVPPPPDQLAPGPPPSPQADGGLPTDDDDASRPTKRAKHELQGI